MDIPKNVEISKDPKRKGLSYPLKTSEIVAGLGLHNCPLPIGISYSNSTPFKEDSFDIFSVTYYGPKSKSGLAFGGARFYCIVQNIPSKYRKRINAVLMKDILPIMKEWQEEVQANPELFHDYVQIIFEYGNQWNITGQDYLLERYLTLHVNSSNLSQNNLVWSHKINLKEDENEPAPKDQQSS